MGRLRAVRGKSHIYKRIPSYVSVTKYEGAGASGAATAFRVCARVGTGANSEAQTDRAMTSGGKPHRNLACASGRNPRKAVAAALRKLAAGVGKRTGAFHGI